MAKVAITALVSFSFLNWMLRKIRRIYLTSEDFGNRHSGGGSDGDQEERERVGGPTEIEKRLESLITRLGERVNTENVSN